MSGLPSGLYARKRRWRVDEMYVKIGGETRYLRRAVDHDGEVLESLLTEDRAFKYLKKGH